jgi:hypothetical protein
MVPGNYVRARQDIDYSPHGVVRKGERGRVSSSGQVMWETAHAGFADWDYTTSVMEGTVDVIRAPIWLSRRLMVQVIAMSVVIAVGLAYVLQQNGIDRFLAIGGITVALCVVQLVCWWAVR